MKVRTSKGSRFSRNGGNLLRQILLAHEGLPGGFEFGGRDAKDALQVSIGLDQLDKGVAPVTGHDELAQQVAKLIDRGPCSPRH